MSNGPRRAEFTLEIAKRSLIKERAEAAREAAAARGRQTGRPRAISEDKVRVARVMKAGGENMSSICAALGVSRSTLYKSFNDLGDGLPV